MNDDYILRIAEAVGKFSAKLFLKKDKNEFEKINLDSISAGGILAILLKKHVLQGKYNEGENLLFEELGKNSCEDTVNAGREFYNMLLLKNDEELEKGNFTRKEIYQGLRDLEKYIE